MINAMPFSSVFKIFHNFVHIFYTLAEPLVLPLHLISSVMVGLWVES